MSKPKKGILEPKGDGTNILGGKNPQGLYVPMSDDEQEVIARLVEADDLILVIHNWAVLRKPHLIVGDLRVGIQFRLAFADGLLPTPLHFLDLELQRESGQTIFRQKKAITVGGKPLMAQGGAFFDFQWDIAIDHMDPQFVKSVKPGAFGLTSRRIDKDTGHRSERGNMQLDSTQQGALAAVDKGAAEVRAGDDAAVKKAEKEAPK